MKGVIRREYFLSKETAIIMAVLLFLALFVGVGGGWDIPTCDVQWNQPLRVWLPEYLRALKHQTNLPPLRQPILYVWFWLLFYPLMPVLKGWYVNIVHSIYPPCVVDVEIVPWPFPSRIVFAVYTSFTLLGFQIPAVWMPFLVHVPYWLAVSYGLSALIHRYEESIERFLAGMVEEMRRLHGYEG